MHSQKYTVLARARAKVGGFSSQFEKFEKKLSVLGRAAWQGVENLKLNSWQFRTLRAIKDCRTSALGGHVEMVVGRGPSALTQIKNRIQKKK